MRARIAVPVVAVAVATMTAAGCGAPRRQAGGGTVTVFAAVSLAEAFGDLRARLASEPGSPAVVYSFGGSQQVVAQVEAGAPAHVVATADPASMARLVDAGLVEAPRCFAANRLAIAVRPGNPAGITGLADLGRRELRVVLADPSVPVGRYGRQALDRAGVVVRPVSLEPDVGSVAAKVRSGEADAGIVYATDLRAPDGVAIPSDANVEATYPVAVVRASANRDGAHAFVERLLGTAGREALSGRGFLVP